MSKNKPIGMLPALACTHQADDHKCKQEPCWLLTDIETKLSCMLHMMDLFLWGVDFRVLEDFVKVNGRFKDQMWKQG